MYKLKFALFASIFAAPVFAADLPVRKSVTPISTTSPACLGLLTKSTAPASTFASVPGGDLFGFTNPADIGAVGDCGTAFEYSARMGKIDGSYYGASLKNQYFATIHERFQVALSPWITHARVNTVTGYNNANTLDFDGLSGELTYQLLARSASNATAIALSVEPRWARVSGEGARLAKAQGIEFKIFADTVLIKDKLYAGMNMNIAFAETRMTDPFAVDSKATNTNISGALSYQVNDKVFVGAEARHLRSYANFGLGTLAGQATYFGPTLLYKINDTTTFNMVWTPQISGAATGVEGKLDLTNFERHQFRVKLVKTF